MDGFQDEGVEEAILPTDFVDGRDGDYSVICTKDLHDVPSSGVRLHKLNASGQDNIICSRSAADCFRCTWCHEAETHDCWSSACRLRFGSCDWQPINVTGFCKQPIPPVITSALSK